jgi:phosphate transport system permease protein
MASQPKLKVTPTRGNIEEGVYRSNINQRHFVGNAWRWMYIASFGVAILALVLLVLTVLNQAFGYVLVGYNTPLSAISDRPLEQRSPTELGDIIEAQGANTVIYVQETMSSVDRQTFIDQTLSQSLPGRALPQAYASQSPRAIPTAERAAVMRQILEANLSAEQLRDLIVQRVMEPQVFHAYPFLDFSFNRARIEQSVIDEYPDQATRPVLEFRSWIRPGILTVPMDENALISGIRTALLGTLYLLLIVAFTAFPIGIMAAIYLEEYADRTNPLNRLIENNIRNLAGVPSIIYGMLGLQLFVRVLEPIMSGAAFGFLGVEAAANGRTILAAGLTLALLVLPVVIINAQEAIRAVPNSYREASYGLGATKWQTIWNQVLPASAPGILTGIILSMSRAVGETAPLVVVGASTFIVADPNGLFSKFTALPIQIYNWTTRAEAGFQELAAATIIVLLVLLFLLNLTAFIMRNNARRALQA